jgi:uncharacterized protein DUF4276
MSENIALFARPPIGFVVEGHDEHACYPSLVARITGSQGYNIPIANARGYGNIVRHLGEQLQDIVLSHHPYHIVVTVDLKEVLADGVYDDCRQLKLELDRQAQVWLAQAKHDSRLQPLPKLITTVIQIQQLESWAIADCQSLREADFLSADEVQICNSDTVPNPATWLRKRLPPRYDLKKPDCAKKIIGCLDLHTMRRNSHSFDKFYRVVSSSYHCWCQACCCT